MVYLLRCRDGSLYTGITNDLTRRLASHQRGTGSAYTRSRRPIALAYQEALPDRGAALHKASLSARDRRRIAASRADKLALCNGAT